MLDEGYWVDLHVSNHGGIWEMINDSQATAYLTLQVKGHTDEMQWLKKELKKADAPVLLVNTLNIDEETIGIGMVDGGMLDELSLGGIYDLDELADAINSLLESV